MPDRAFFDTNVLIYAFSRGDPRQNVALNLLRAGGTIGVQTLNEFVNVVTRKLKTPWPEAMLWLETIEELCPRAVPMTLSVHRRGLRIAQAFGYRLYDSLMLAAALEGSCTVFYSEDMHGGQVIDNMTIHNPFG
jgi:predicted nucleic acid-binding protein